MGELARAVLQEQALFSRPRWYTAETPDLATPVTGQQVTLLFNIELYTKFLMTSFITYAVGNVSNGSSTTVLAQEAYSLQFSVDRSYKESYQGAILNANQASFKLFDPVELAEYILLDENETLRATLTILVPSNDSIYSLTICGVEYLKP